MKRLNNCSTVLVTLVAIAFGTNAYAWPKCGDGSTAMLDEAGKYQCPSPAGSGAPVTVTDTTSSDADAAAKSISNALAGGGNADATGGDAKAISDNWNKLSTEQKQTLEASLTQDQRQSLKSALTNNNSADGNGSGNILKTGDANAAANGNGSNNKTGDATASGNGSGNQSSYTSNVTYKHIEVPVLFNPVPPSVTSTSLMSVETFACGPLQQVKKTQVLGTHLRTFRKTSVDLGNDYELAPVLNDKGERIYYTEQTFAEGGDAVVRRFGTQAIVVTALPNVSGASSMSIGFGGNNGGGSAGAGSSSAMSRIVTKITLADCELPGAYKVVASKAPTLSREDVNGALNALSYLRIEVPTQRVETERIPCKMEEFTDASGKKILMCPGPKGSYVKSRVVQDTATGVAQSNAAGRVAPPPKN